MAAKPPKPPGSFLNHSIFNTTSNNNKNNNTNNGAAINGNKVTDAEAASGLNPTSAICAKANDNCNNLLTSSPAKKANCNCTNITIMHLFHEMKQEFPTIPDTIVAQCVNENCHQRENCIQMLRHELELNPIPVQSYPAKVLHPPTNHSNNNSNSNSNSNSNNNNHFHHNTTTAAAATSAVTSPQKPPLQQKPVVQHRPPLKPPLRPVRPAPLQPPTAAATANSNRLPPAIQHSKSPLLPKRSTSIPNQSAPPLPPPPTSSIRSLSVDHGIGGAAAGGGGTTGEADINEKLNDMPAKTTTAIQSTPQRPSNSPPRDDEVNNNDNNCLGVGETNVGNLPRARPTTLNLNTQQQQRQLLNVQLQEHFQQQRKQQQQQPTNAGSAINKPLRKAPLPPIAPKPILFHHTTTNNSAHNHSAGDSLASPLSESEISVNVSLSTPSPTSSTSSASLTTSKTHHSQHLHNKSPIRHRSVITLQPEPPYTRDFLSQTPAAIQTPTTTANSSSVVSSPTNSGSSQKSYTSVNLTLRPPTTVPNSALQPSTIDITAGPGFSGASGGGKSLSYSSTSYDARLGYQQNFHITVTDEGGVFSASRRRPQQQQRNQVNICEYENDGNSGGDKCNNNNNVNSLCAEKQQQQSHSLQHQQQQYLQQNQEFHNTDVVALRQPQHLQQQHQQQQNPYKINCFQGTGGNRSHGNMCLAPPPTEDDAFVTETMERQKKRRDRLAAALRENKKRLSQVEQEVNLITGPIPDGLSERLDIEIQKLRAECQAMLRSSNPLTQQQRPQPQQYQQQQQQQQFPPQPFPRQRSTRPPPPRQTSLDIIQHHTATPSTPHTPASLPNFINTPSPIMLSSPQQQHQYQQLQHSHSLSPSIYQQQQQQQGMSYQQHPQQQQHNHHNLTSAASYADDEPSYYSDPDAGDYEDDEDDEYEVVEHWECSMCTFRNHPQLNICECCDNVRIIPGTLTNLSRAISTNSASSATGAGAVAGAAGLTSVTNRSVTDVNAVASSAAAARVGSMNSLNTASAAAGNSNLEHETNLAQQQLQHFALHT